MFKGRETRENIKKYLVISSAVLAGIWLLVILCGFLGVMSKELAKAKELEQHFEFESGNLPSGPSYIVEEDGSPEMAPETGAYNIPSDTPKIAILLTNLGLNQNSTELAVALPGEISSGFLPYTSSLKPLFAKAKELNHELFVYLPFETKDYPADFPGHFPILKEQSNEENVKRLNALLNVFEGYQGVYGSYKEVCTEDNIKSSAIIDELNQRNLSLFLGRQDGDKSFKGEKNIKTLSADIILDLEPNVTSIKENLDKLIEIAQEKKTAIAYAEGYPVSIYTLKACLPMLKSKNIELVPASHILQDQRRKGRDEKGK